MLIRALEPLEGIELMRARRGRERARGALLGPRQADAGARASSSPHNGGDLRHGAVTISRRGAAELRDRQPRGGSGSRGRSSCRGASASPAAASCRGAEPPRGGSAGRRRRRRRRSSAPSRRRRVVPLGVVVAAGWCVGRDRAAAAAGHRRLRVVGPVAGVVAPAGVVVVPSAWRGPPLVAGRGGRRRSWRSRLAPRRAGRAGGARARGRAAGCRGRRRGARSSSSAAST